MARRTILILVVGFAALLCGCAAPKLAPPETVPRVDRIPAQRSVLVIMVSSDKVSTRCFLTDTGERMV